MFLGNAVQPPPDQHNAGVQRRGLGDAKLLTERMKPEEESFNDSCRCLSFKRKYALVVSMSVLFLHCCAAVVVTVVVVVVVVVVIVVVVVVLLFCGICC